MSFRTFDCHVHIGPCKSEVVKSKKDFTISSSEVLNYLESNNIQKALIFPFPNPNCPTDNMNEYVLSCVERNRERLYGLFYFSWREDLRKLTKLATTNIAGLKIHPVFSKHHLTDFPDDFLDLIRKNSWILLVDSSVSEFSHPRYIVEFARRNPSIFVICAHMARLFHKEVVELSTLNNVYVDLSGICLLSKDSHRLAPVHLRHSSLKEGLSPRIILEYLIEFIGEKRIIWGSDYPFPNMFGRRLKNEIRFVLEESANFLDVQTHHNIFHDNLESLLLSRNN